MGWGSPTQVTDVDYQINKFYNVLLGIPHWQELRPGDAAQTVESSGYPLRYHQWEPMAAHLVSVEGQVRGFSGCERMPAASVLANRAIDYANHQIGKPYVWGAAGPDTFDCSGLVQQAWKAAGVDIPKYTQTQYEQGGQQVPISQAQPGDLVFWGSGRDPKATHHVAMYLGNNEIVQAPQPGENVEKTKMWDGGELLPMAVRPAGGAPVHAAAPAARPASGGLPPASAGGENVPAADRRGTR
jgi:hypothetical protein